MAMWQAGRLARRRGRVGVTGLGATAGLRGYNETVELAEIGL